MIPIKTEARLRTTPWMNYGIIAVNCLMFLILHRLRRSMPALELHPRHPTMLAFFTYSLMHANVGHLASNMLFLYIFGNNVNDKMGHVGYAAFYLSAGIIAGVCYVAGGDVTPVIGASGAVAAVTGAFIVLFPRVHVTLLYFFMVIGFFEIPSVWFIAFFFVKDLFLNFSGAATGVAHVAHIAGTLFGFIACFALLMFNLLPRDHYDVVALAKQWNRRRQFRDLTASGYNPFGAAERLSVEKRLPQPMSAAQEKVQDIKGQISDAMARHDHAKAAQLYLQMKQVDRDTVLARQAQLDVANQLASEQRYADAAEAYESFLKYYKNFEQVEQVELMLGLIYARYLNKYPSAKELLLRAMARLHSDNQLSLARSELSRIEPLIG
jgi:membrane associated rhomboid family serine protease